MKYTFRSKLLYLFMVVCMVAMESGFADPATITPLQRGSQATPFTWQQLDSEFTNIAVTANSANTKVISVKDYAAVPNGSGDQTSNFNQAITQIGTFGSKITVPAGAYTVNTVPSLPANVEWLFDLNTVINSSVGWPVDTLGTLNGTGVKPLNRWIHATPQFNNSGTASAAAVDTIDIIQPSGTSGQFIGIHVSGMNNSTLNDTSGSTGVVGIKSKVANIPGATGEIVALTGTVNSYSVAATNKAGLILHGSGTTNPDYGINIYRNDSSSWGTGVNVSNTLTGINISNTGIGLIIGNTVNTNGPVTQDIALRQLSNGGDVLFGQRNTDSLPYGNFLRFSNAINGADLFTVDVNGNESANTIKVNAPATAATNNSSLVIGNTTALTATPGAATLPASPAGYITIYIGTTPYKLPYYNN